MIVTTSQNQLPICCLDANKVKTMNIVNRDHLTYGSSIELVEIRVRTLSYPNHIIEPLTLHEQVNDESNNVKDWSVDPSLNT
jgi:hypothetical protein